MKNFGRAVRLALRQRVGLIASICGSLLVAILWGANIGTIYPFIQVVFRGDSLHEWVDSKLREGEQNCAQIREAIDQLHSRHADSPGEQRESFDRQIALQQDRLTAEERALGAIRSIQPFVQQYLPSDPFRTLMLIVAFLLLGTLIKGLVLVATSVLVARLVQQTTLDLRDQFYRHTLAMDLSEFGQKHSGDLLSRFTNDLGAVSGGIGTLFGDSVREPLKVIVCLAGAAMISWRLLLFSSLLMPLSFFLTSRITRRVKRANRKSLDETATLYHQLNETFAGIQTVKAFGMEPVESDRLHSTGKQLYRRALQLTLFGAMSKPVYELLGIAAVCLALLAGGYLVLNQETHLLGIKMSERPLDFGAMSLFFGLLLGASEPARKLQNLLGDLQRAAAAADRIYPLMDSQPNIADPPHPLPLPEHQRELCFERVKFHYLPGQPVLQNLDLRIPFGESLAIVGPNGCGKSTLLNLILRFYDPVEGYVSLDGLDLRQVRLSELRKQIGMVTQQTLLFDDTVMNNIRYGSPEATDAQVVEAAKKAHAHQFIEEVLEHGYQTVIGERGGRLSGGQRQRIALARAILRDPPLLILDEATSQIDPESEQLIHQALEQFIQGRTSIMVTHRMSTLALANRILVMERGQIAGLGTHQELLASCDTYRRLYHSDLRKSA